jgi:phosphoserine aminotransferase
MNFLPKGAKADYVINGVFGEKALAEANIVASGAGAKIQIAANTGVGEHPVAYVRAPSRDELVLDPEASYVHFTSNETINGIQFHELADFGRVPVVCDMSSDILSKPIDVDRFDFIYAGAQKNIGPSGVVVGIGRKDFLARGRKDIPHIFQYGAFAAANSLLNTPPTFGIYLVRNVLAWVKEQGGLEAMDARNREKARILYAAIDADPGFYRCPVEPKSRSTMNVIFRLRDESLEEQMVSDARAKGMVGIKGHRAVGGLRVSLYNAVEPAWVRELASFMKEFARANG